MKIIILNNLKYLLIISAFSIFFGYQMGALSYNSGIFILTMVNFVYIMYYLWESNRVKGTTSLHID